MALPLIYLAGVALGGLALADAKSERDKQQRLRRYGVTLDSGIEPSAIFKPQVNVAPKLGSIVCCYVYGVVEHTGIWIGDNSIVELHGSGLVRPVSIQRFLHDRSGSQIFIASSTQAEAFANQAAYQRSVAAIYQYRDYHLFNNNCHRFTWYCLTGQERMIDTFTEFNQLLQQRLKQVVCWDGLLNGDENESKN